MAMTKTKDRLAKKRQQEQDVRNYPPSSRWYTSLNNAINYVELAETSTAPKDQFLNAWSAIYNLYMMTHVRGQIENVTLSGWIDLIKQVPDVRRLCEQVSDDFLQQLDKTKKTLLLNAEQNLYREGLKFLQTWQSKRREGKELSADKACTYTFLIGRDIRNAVSHPTINPNARTTKKALSSAANLFLSIAIAAIEATIEHPPEGTTGKATAYRSFLYPFMVNSDSFFSDYYLERLMPDQELTEFDEKELKETLKQFNRDRTQLESQLMAEDADREVTAKKWCEPVLFPALGINEPYSGLQIVSEQAVFEPSYAITRSGVTVQSEYQGKAAGKDLACLVWVVPWRSRSLDAVPEEENYKEAFSGLTWMEIGQRSLLASDVPWAIVTNGRKLRLLGKGTAHKPRAFVEMTLEEIMNQRGKAEGKLAFRYLLGLFSGVVFTERDENGNTPLDRVLSGSERHGKEISDELKENVFRALEELGDGFLNYMKSHSEVVQDYKNVYELEPVPSETLLKVIYEESLGLMYRLLFLFYAESRDLLPMDEPLYAESYSLEFMRNEIIKKRDSPDSKMFFGRGDTELWNQLKELFSLIQGGGLAGRIPAYNGGLFDPEKHPFLEHFAIGDYYLARAIDLLSRTRPSKDKPRGEGRKKVTYRDLDVRHLGSIYEGILEYSAHIADQEMAIVVKTSKGSKYEKYATLNELTAKEREDFNAYKKALEEDQDDPIIASRSKVTDVKEKGQYFLVSGGRDSKRRSSGSYYTPDYIVQYIVDNTLGPLVRGENREGELRGKLLDPDEILSLKVLDPAMGSGHFLVAATEFLARAYGEAMIRTGRDIDGVMDKHEFVHYKRTVAERCVYGIDINPMAVELAKLSMWLFTMDQARPLSFLNHHFKDGDALSGAWISELGQPPNSSGKIDSNQTNLFDYKFRQRVPAMVKDVFSIMDTETNTVEDIKLKKSWEQAIRNIKAPFIYVSNCWVNSLTSQSLTNYYALLLDIDNGGNIAEDKDPGARRKLFHWEIEFPEAFFDSSGNWADEPGFDAVIGNPPWGSDFDDQELLFHKSQNREIIVRMIDSFMYFVYRTGKHLAKGYISMIVPDVLAYQGDNSKLRRFLLENFSLEKVLNVGLVFEGVTRPAMLFLAEKSKTRPENNNSVCIIDVSHKQNEEKPESIYAAENSEIVKQGFFRELPNFIFPTANIDRYKILDKIRQSKSVALSTLIDSDGIQRGVSPDFKDAFIVNTETKVVHSLEDACMKRVLTGGKNVRPYFIEDHDQWLIYTTRNDDFSAIPNICKYIESFADRITCKEVKNGKHPLYSLHRPREKTIFEKEQKFVGVITGDRIIVALDTHRHYASDGIYLFDIKQDVDHYFLLGLLNSKLITFMYRLIALEKGRVLAQVKPTVMNKLLIKQANLEHERDLCEQITDMSRKLASLYQSDVLSVRNKAHGLELEASLNKAVFSLYGLNESDIQIIQEDLT